MKKQQILIIALLVIIGGYYFISSNFGESPRIERRDFAIDKIETVDKIIITSKRPSSFELTKTDNGWFLDGKYPAKEESMKYILETLEKMEIKYPVSKNSTDRVLTDLTTIGVKVEVFDGSKNIKTFYVGNNTPDEMGTYMMLKGAISPYAIHIPGFEGYLKTRFSSNPLLWRSKSVFNIDNKNIEWINMEYPNRKEDGYKIVQNGDDVSLFDFNGKKQTIKSLVVKQYLANFKNIEHEGFIASYDPVQPEEIKTLPKMFNLTIKEKGKEPVVLKSYMKTELKSTEDGKVYTKIVDRDRLYATDGDSFFLIQYFVFNPMLKQIVDFK